MSDDIPYNPLESTQRSTLKVKMDDVKDDRSSIIIVHNDRPAYLNLCLQSLNIATRNNNYEIIVVDNGSEDQKTKDFLDDLESDGMKVIRNDENLYWTKAVNQGIKAADKNSDFYIVMHHDIVILNKNWLDMMIGVSQSHQSGVVGYGMKKYEISTQDVRFVDEFCMLITKECYQDIGPFQEELPQEGSSFIFSFTATRKGYNPQVVANEGIIHHWKSFAVDYSKWEKITDHASVTVPKFLKEIQDQ